MLNQTAKTAIKIVACGLLLGTVTQNVVFVAQAKQENIAKTAAEEARPKSPEEAQYLKSKKAFEKSRDDLRSNPQSSTVRLMYNYQEAALASDRLAWMMSSSNKDQKF